MAETGPFGCPVRRSQSQDRTAASHGIVPEISPAADPAPVPAGRGATGPAPGPGAAASGLWGALCKKKALSTAKRGRRHGANRGFTVIAPATCGYTDHAPRRVPLAEDAQYGSQGRAEQQGTGGFGAPQGPDPAMQPSDCAHDFEDHQGSRRPVVPGSFTRPGNTAC